MKRSGREKRISNELEDHEEGEGPWLLSYADMVTLLMCFFILFFNVEKPDESLNDIENLARKLANVIGIDQTLMAQQTKQSESNNRQRRKAKEEAESQLRSLAKNLKVAFTARTPEDGVTEITFLNSNFFQSGSANLTASGEKMIRSMAPRLKNFIDADSEIEVSGHSDGDPIRSPIYPSNWELSASRATSVVRLLIESGIEPQNLKAVGLAATRPVAQEVNEDGLQVPSAKMLNRRVVIRIRDKVERPE